MSELTGQIGISLSLSDEQFNALDLKLGGVHGAVDKLAENISEPDTSVAAEISLLRNELGMRLTAINESVNAMSNNIGKWLSAIALASSTPNDNSAEVQKQIDEFTLQLNTSTAALQGEIDQRKKEI